MVPQSGQYEGSPVPQAGRLSVGRVRSLATKFRCSMQRPVDHFSHLRYINLLTFQLYRI